MGKKKYDPKSLKNEKKVDPKKLCPKHCDQKTFLIQKMGSNKFCMQIKFGSKVLGQEEFRIEKVLAE